MSQPNNIIPVPGLLELMPHVFFNLDEIRRSTRIGCCHCAFIFLYDGTEETEPFHFGHTAQCPVCESFMLLGDASGYPIHSPFLLTLFHFISNAFSHSQQSESSDEALLYYGYAHALQNLPNTLMESSCFACGHEELIDPAHCLCYGKTLHCSVCSEPTIIPRMKFDMLYRLWYLMRQQNPGFRQYAASEEDWLYREYRQENHS